jgi:prevent-host-death family protein
MELNIRKARERFSEIVNLAAVKGERIILLAKNKPKAAIVSLRDLEQLEEPLFEKAKKRAQIERIGRIRKRIRIKGEKVDSAAALRKLREERIERL